MIFYPQGVLSTGMFFLWDDFSPGQFVPSTVFPWDGVSLGWFAPRMVCLWNVLSPEHFVFWDVLFLGCSVLGDIMSQEFCLRTFPLFGTVCFITVIYSTYMYIYMYICQFILRYM